MSRVFRRPMFRKGGPSKDMNGIMTGIVDRSNHATDGGPVMDYINKIIPTASEMEQFQQAMPKPAERTGLDDPLTQFLLTYGSSVASQKPTGSTLGTLLAASKEPVTQLLKDVREDKQLEYATQSDAFKTLLEAKAEAMSGAGSQKTYRDLVVADEIKKLVPQITDLENKLKNENLSDADRNALRDQLEAAKINLNNLRKDDPTGEALLQVFLKGPGQTFFITTQERLLRENRKKYPKGENDPQLLEDTIREVRRYLQQIADTRTTQKDGGRIGYAVGTPQPQQVQQSEEQPISYDQLRARLPKEINDDIVLLMANSAEALEDFATIASQQDVDNFNKKYNVNLVLPAEA